MSLDQIDFGGCATQTQIDREITYANRAGLDYWAFIWYGKKDDMQNAWRLYRATQIQKNIKWCMIFANCSLFVKELSNSPDEYLDYFRDRDYQKVLGGRPLIYLLPDPAPLSTLSSAIGAMRSSCRSARLSDPYVVFLTGAIRYAAELVGADAVGIYSKATKAPVAGPYAELAEADKVYWSQLASTGQSVVPTVLTGADRRPRVERPVPWEASRQKPYVGDDLYYVAGTPEEIAAHVRELITWVDENPATCPARTGLIYSWDEHDEGGSTLNPTLGDGSAILDAVTRVLTRDK
ncbi:hypothetical protein [Bradyrhizobium sp. 62]|uniref:hypothetical protein n=1 Tax=Bradyrhizobium sp. 62 TaxID=1043588 RepID=UPI001FFB80DD|nr:hypothetical protein [Bradyrhizobium sp. 62]MCK1368308.1 hypothetical protein [Bradyrhizobium sp. 62]